jgi:hypothetical protein
VLAIERVVLDAPVGVYNFTVAGMHTYFVLEVGVLVHNCGPSIVTVANFEEAQQLADDTVQANSGQQVLFRGVSFDPLNFPTNAFRAGKFRSALYAEQSVSQIAQGNWDWQKLFREFAPGHGTYSRNTPFLSSTKNFRETRRFASGLFSSDSGYIFAFTVDDRLRPLFPNIYNRLEPGEILVPIGIKESEIHKIINVTGGLQR